MKTYCIRDDSGMTHYVKAKNLSDAVAIIRDKFDVEGMKKHVSSILQPVKQAYSLVLQSSREWIVQLPEDLEYLANQAQKAAKTFREKSKEYFKDSTDVDEIEYLSDEEEQAIEDYKEAIKGTTDLKLLKLYAHILQEEIEHLEELENEAIEDSIKDVPDLETSHGKQQYFEQIAMSSLDVVPTRMWNKQGSKINIDNNHITLIITKDGITLKTESGISQKYDNKKDLSQAIQMYLKNK